jgi:hypothetical protein
MVVASAVNSEGEQLYPRKWNHDFIDMPVVERSKQNTPLLSGGDDGSSELGKTNRADAVHPYVVRVA